MLKRLFIALELPTECREWLAAVPEPILGARWVAADQLHLTLAFLGHIGAESERRLRGGLAELQVPHFKLRLHGVGMFRAGQTAVIWAGVEDAHDGLSALHREVHLALAAADIEMNPAPFHPHITLARLKNVPAHKRRSFLEANRSRGFGTMQFNDFTLFSSTLDPIGAIHHVEERYALVSG